MNKFIASLLALSLYTCPVALADTVEIKAYSAPSGEVLLLPATQTFSSFKVLNNGAVVKSGGTLTLLNEKTVTLPSVIEPGMLISPTGAVIGTDAVIGTGEIKVKTKKGRTVIKFDD